ncbi:MAG: alpha/beta hydrolase [Candidatus Neomarinimicrobiota bacterium]
MKFICLHGFGVRGNFWDPLIPELSKLSEKNVIAPDLDFSTIDSAINSSRNSIINNQDNVSVIIGHSLGAVLALRQELVILDNENIYLILLGCGLPMKMNSIVIAITRMIMKYGYLLPDHFWQPRFFSPITPQDIQDKFFSKVVKESNTFINELTSKNNYLLNFLENIERSFPRTLFITGTKDSLTTTERTVALANKLNATFISIDNAGHNDLIYSESVRKKVVKEIISFLGINL